jgi:hypothetical protein
MTTDDPIPWAPDGFDPASLLGAASDKTTTVSIDQMVYLNTILGINYVDVSSGTVVYYDFATYDYSRAVVFAGTTVTYLKDEDGDGTYEQVTESVMDAVFGGADWVDPSYDPATTTDAGGADDFAQAADDARAVIDFIHSVPVATVPAT